MLAGLNNVSRELDTGIDPCGGELDFQLSSTKYMIDFSRIIYDG